VKTPKAIYVAPGEYEIEGKAYEFLVSSEDGLRKVAEEILGVKGLKLDTVVNIIQAALWALVLLLGYLGYKNDVLREASSYMIVLLALSWAIENFRTEGATKSGSGSEHRLLITPQSEGKALIIPVSVFPLPF